MSKIMLARFEVLQFKAENNNDAWNHKNVIFTFFW